jgi:Uma2 family endonuclease
MSQLLRETPFDLSEIVKNLVTEDDEPVDNLFSAKQQRLLVEPLYSSWTPPLDEEAEAPTTAPRPFLADANVGIFYSVYEQPIVPDMFLSLDVQISPEWQAEEHRSYFTWEFGKPPDVVVEIVSNREGHELDRKLRQYAKLEALYYVVFDPWEKLKGEVLCVYERGFGRRFRPRKDLQLPEVGLSVMLWQGTFENWAERWLRWCDPAGNLIPTGAERAQQAEDLAAHEAAERQRAEAQIARLAAKLRELGIEPE